MGGQFVLAIDQGTTSTRASLVDQRGRFVKCAKRRHRQYYPASGWVEHDASEILANIEELITEVTSSASTCTSNTATVTAIAIANQGETVLAWDGKTLEPLCRAIVWQDTRSQAWVNTLRKDKKLSRLVKIRTGLNLDPYFCAGKVRWLLDKFGTAPDLQIGTLESWLIAKLTGGKRFVTDVTTAARTLYFDIQKLQYDLELLDIFRIPQDVLASVIATDGDFGELAHGPLKGVPIIISMVDQPAALYGHGCVLPNQMKATFGTGCFIYLHTGDRIVRSESGLLSTIAWQFGGSTAYALDGGVLAAGSVIEWMFRQTDSRQTNRCTDFSLIEKLQKPQNKSLFCLPCFSGLSAPHWERNVKAAFIGLDLGTTKQDLLYAALEGIALSVSAMIRLMGRELGTPINSLSVDGGLTKSQFFMQLLADITGSVLRVSTDSELTLKGVARAAWQKLQPCHTTFSQNFLSFEPRMSDSQRMERHSRYEKAVEVARCWE